jgi:hypothetical protein
MRFLGHWNRVWSQTLIGSCSKWRGKTLTTGASFDDMRAIMVCDAPCSQYICRPFGAYSTTDKQVNGSITRQKAAMID